MGISRAAPLDGARPARHPGPMARPPIFDAVTSPDLPAPLANYAHAVLAPPGARLLVTSGQLAMRPDGTIPEGAEAQAHQCFHQIAAILAAAGAGPANVLRLNAYVTAREHMPAYMTARDAFLGGLTPPPASTLVIVGGFTRAEFLVEVEATAAIGA